ncbi:MAG: archease [bacterium]|nr:archease [bacterium]
MTSTLFYQFKSFLKKVSPAFLLDFYHFFLAFLAALIYGFSSRKIKTIGVTGTSGKSTVVAMMAAILEEAGFKVASLSSIRFCIAGKEEVNNKRMTLPGRFFVQQFLSRAVKAGCQYAVLEITSEGIAQHRHRFIGFEAVVFTNLSLEHIESHGSFEKYREVKGKLFKACRGIHILNLDDENIDYFNRFRAREKWGYSIERKVQSAKRKTTTENLKFIEATNCATIDGLRFFTGNTEFNLGLLGEFNIYNALAAIAVARSQGIDLEACRKALEGFKGVPGRMEEVIFTPFKAFVDYAITPVALEKVYQTLVSRRIPDTRYQIPDTKLICVLGSCGGGRDKWKRPVLGQIAAKHCGQIILTNEDPYDENPQEIVDDIKKGIQNTKYQIQDTKVILDRRQAISKALGLAQPGDTVIITGKGCEPSMCLANGKQITWDDRQVVREEMRKLQKYQESSLPLLNGRQKVVLEEVEKQYEILEHKADLKIRVFGKTREDLFQNAMLGMFAAADYQSDENGEVVERKIEIDSFDSATLLVDFLSRVICLCEANQEIYDGVELAQLSEKRLEGELSGRKLKQMGVQIKGATYHGLDIHQNQEGSWEATVLFDV